MLIYSTLAGSRLYGYNKPDSDYDYRGVFLAPKAQILGLWTLQEVQESIVDNVDTVNYELRKFAKLALKGNPNILEILFSEKAVLQSEYWDRLRAVRHSFLSQKIRAPYSGFLLSEIRKLHTAYEPKAAANAWRLVQQGIEILSTGDFNPTLEASKAQVMKDIRNNVLSADKVLTSIIEQDRFLQEVYSNLPEEPNAELISEIVTSIYEDHYATEQSDSKW